MYCSILKITALKAKYDNLETQLVKKRVETHKALEGLSNKLGELLSASRREVQLCEARLRDNHQV